MRRVDTAIWALILCAVLAASPMLVELASEGGRLLETPLPAEVDERLSDSEVEERSRVEAYKGMPFLSTAFEVSPSHDVTLSTGLRFTRHDDPVGSRAHGLRAPPA